MTPDFTNNMTSMSSTATASSGDDYGRALDAIRIDAHETLEALLRAMSDRDSFFSDHGVGLIDAVVSDDNADCLTVMLKAGMRLNANLIERIVVAGHAGQRQVLREFTDKSDTLKRWVRESEHFRRKFRYKITSIF
jgi:hypothetical protein